VQPPRVGARRLLRQRADRYNEMGKPKSEAGERTIPLGPFVVNTLKEWPARRVSLVWSFRTPWEKSGITPTS
jgi:hypothetical protein